MSLLVLAGADYVPAVPGTSTLILETSTPQASLALAGPGDCLIEREFASDRSHQACLFGPLAEMLDNLAGNAIGRVLVGSGPGSYSGTRVGIAAAQGVALARNCPAVAVPSILAMPAADGGAACLVIGDARRGGYWLARVAAWQMAEPLDLTDAAGLGAAVSSAVQQGMPVVACDDPARFPLPAGLAGQVQQEFPTAGRLWRVWCMAGDVARAVWAAAPPQPLYLKPPHITPAKRPWLLPG